jgi:hypothetical protein
MVKTKTNYDRYFINLRDFRYQSASQQNQAPRVLPVCLVLYR